MRKRVEALVFHWWERLHQVRNPLLHCCTAQVLSLLLSGPSLELPSIGLLSWWRGITQTHTKFWDLKTRWELVPLLGPLEADQGPTFLEPIKKIKTDCARYFLCLPPPPAAAMMESEEGYPSVSFHTVG